MIEELKNKSLQGQSTKENNSFTEVRGTALTKQIGRVFRDTGSSSAHTTVIA